MQTEMANYKYAGFWIRFVATLMDTILICAIVYPILFGIYGKDYFVSESIIYGVWDFLFSWILPAIATIIFWKYKSATPGKMVIKAIIVDAETGESPSNGQLIFRYFAYLLSILPLGLGFVWIAWDPSKQSFHDKLSGTVVIRSTGTSEPLIFKGRQKNKE